MQRKLFVILFFAVVFFINQQNIFACSCRGKATVLDAFDDAELVIVASVISVEKAEEGNNYYSDGIKSAKMLVEKVYKGTVNARDELTFMQGGESDCRWRFDEKSIGRKNLLYLRKPYNSMYHATICDRSGNFEEAFDDLAFLEKLEQVRGKTRIYGIFGSWLGGKSVYANIKIKIIGNEKIYEAKTDENGFFEIYDLPEGMYKIEPQIPKGWAMSNFGTVDLKQFVSVDKSKNQVTVFLQSERHAAVDLHFVPDTFVRGKITSPDGKPMKDIQVSLISESDLKEGDYFGKWIYTDETGFYKFDGFPPGNYTIVLNANGKINKYQPFGRLFFPGVSDAIKAKIFTVNAVKPLDDINIRVPKIVEMIEIIGSFMYSDNQPVIEKAIQFKPFDINIYDSFSTKTDKQGRFELKIPKGADGLLAGEIYTYDTSDDIKKCPNLKKMIEANGGINLTAKSNEIEIQGKGNLSGIKLTVDFPCEIQTFSFFPSF